MKSIFLLIRQPSLIWALAFTFIVAVNLNTVHGDSPPQPATTKAPENQPIVKPQARLMLTNGDKLSGHPQNLNNKQQLLFSSQNLYQNAHFPLTSILSLQFNEQRTPKATETIARIQLHPRFNELDGDTILGKLKELTPESIKLDTSYGGIIALKRSMIKSLAIMKSGKGNYYGPSSIDEWTQADNGTWHFSKNQLVSRGKGGIGKDVGLLEKSHLSFDASWTKSMQFKLHLYSSDIKSTSAEAYYEVNINKNHAYMRTARAAPQGIAQGFRGVGGGRWQQLLFRPTGTQAHFDIFTDRKTGSITIYIDGNRACILQSQNPNPENLGSGLVFISEASYPIKISNIIVSPWNGTILPKLKKKQKDPASDAEDQPPHRIILINGDEVPGTVGIVKEGRMTIQTEHTAVSIPIDKIKSLSLGASNEAPKKYREDVRGWFNQGGFITLKLATVENQKITGFNQAMGDVTLDLAAFRRIDFHIYDEQANEAREKMSL